MIHYGAVTFDTQSIQAQGFRFESGFLQAFRQFKDSCIRVLISVPVKMEIVKHLEETNQKYHSEILKCILEAKKYCILKNKNFDLYPYLENPRDVASFRFEEFCFNTGMQVVSCDNVLMSEVLDLYISSKPPFGNKNKKNEFPDAISLLSLEKWAVNNKTRILAISEDKDWISFSDNSIWIDVVKSPKEALIKLQENPLHLEAISDKFIKELFEDMGEFYNKILNYIKTKFLNSKFEAEADSYYQWEWEFDEVEVYDWDTIYSNDGCGSHVIEQSEAGFSSVVGILVDLTVKGSFSFFRYDSKSGEVCLVGSSYNSTTIQLDTNLILNFRNNGKIGDLFFDSCQIDTDTFKIDCGYVYSHDEE
ncbi:PIN domain-containing protein [Acetobacter pasteurianus]